jgi:RecA-family ATPase
MHLISLLGELNNELGVFDKERRFSLAPRFEQIKETAIAHDIRFIVLDNASHFYAGNENARNEVAAFTNALNRLAGELHGAVLLVAHPNKAGDEYSGSTAWENQVRARLFLGMVEDEAGNVIDADLRVLRRSKTNYDKKGTEVQFRWHEWAYVLPTDLPENEYKKYQEGMQLVAENTRFLDCLKKLNAQKINVSHSPQAANYAPKKMAQMPMASGMQRHQFARAMERLLDCGSIVAQSKVFENEKRQPVLGLVILDSKTDDLGAENDPE